MPDLQEAPPAAPDDTQPAPTTTRERLEARFPKADHKQVPKGSVKLTYAPWTSYVARLNDVFGINGWSFRVVREGFTETECWVVGEVTVDLSDGPPVVRQQYGCESIKRGQYAAGDLLKVAGSDALKKAASLLGVGLYLSIEEEREALKQEIKEEQRAEKNPTRAGTSAAGPGSKASPAAGTPSTSPAGKSSSSTTGTTVPLDQLSIESLRDKLRAGVMAAVAAQLDTGLLVGVVPFQAIDGLTREQLIAKIRALGNAILEGSRAT